MITSNSQELDPILTSIHDKNFDLADSQLKDLIKDISIKIYKTESEQNIYTIDESEDYSRMVAESSN